MRYQPLRLRCYNVVITGLWACVSGCAIGLGSFCCWPLEGATFGRCIRPSSNMERGWLIWTLLRRVRCCYWSFCFGVIGGTASIAQH